MSHQSLAPNVQPRTMLSPDLLVGMRRWNDTFMISVPPVGGLLRIELYDHDVASTHDFLGQTQVQLTRGPEDSPAPYCLPVRSYPLKPSRQNPGQSVQGTVSFSVQEEEQVDLGPIVIGVLRIIVCEARDLPKMDTLSDTDAYAQIQVEDAVAATKTIRDTQFPVWNEDFTFDVHSSESTCVVRLFDHDPVDTDDPIGEVPVPYTHLIGGDEVTTETNWYAIQQSLGGPASNLGELKLDVRWQPNLDATNGETGVGIGAVADASPETGQLLLTVIEAQSLPKMDLFGKNDVYVSATLKKAETDSVELRTSTIEGGGSDPRWKGGQGETLSFDDVDSNSLPVRVGVYDEDKGGDDLIGQCYASLDEVTASDEGFVDVWKDLTTEKGARGRLRVVIQWRADLEK